MEDCVDKCRGQFRHLSMPVTTTELPGDQEIVEDEHEHRLVEASDTSRQAESPARKIKALCSPILPIALQHHERQASSAWIADARVA